MKSALIVTVVLIWSVLGTSLLMAQQPRGAETAGSLPFDLDQFRAEQCQVTKRDNGLRVTFRAAEKSGLIARAQQAWDWSRFSNLSLDLQNPGKQPVNFLVRVDDESPVPPAKMPTARGTIGPGESARFAVQLPLDGHAQGMQGLPTEPASRPLLLEGPARLNMAHVIGFGIFLDRTRGPQDLVITGVRLMPPVPLDRIVDRYGQYTRADWPGKLKNDSEWSERRQAEDADLKAHVPPSDRNRFGGSKTLTAPNKSGFFRTAKVGGKWWLVDPDGGVFFSVAVQGMNVSGGTWVAGRENMFTWLPQPGDPLAKYFRVRKFGNPPVDRRMYDFYAANLERRYGADWNRAWTEIWLRRLPSWGFNSIGNWSAPFYKNNRIPYTATVMEIRGNHQRLEGGGGVGTMHDPFDPAFARDAAESIRQEAGAARGDPWCIGCFIDNELNWSGMGDDERRETLAYSALGAPRGSAAKGEFVKQLRARYGQVARLNGAWATSFADWNALDGPVKLDPKGPAARKADCRLFVKSLAEKYFKTVREAFKKEDPDHLYLGCRFSVWTPEVAEAAAEFCDVVSFNIYADRLDPTKSSQGTSVFSRLDKPCLISEFQFGALDRGMFHPSYAGASDQTNRGSKFKGYVESALDHPTVVGCHWFGAFDVDLTAPYWASGDWNNGNCGLVSVTDTPYPELIAAARDVLGRIYTRRSGKGKTSRGS